jgi:PAS domain S-box-containing protein
MSVFTDISDLKRTEEALRTSEETARALLNAATESMMLTDGEGRILDLNKIAARRFGGKPEEMIGTTLADVMVRSEVPPELSEARAEAFRGAAESGTPTRFEDGYAGLMFDHNFYPIHGEDGTVNRLALFSRDRTAEKLAEERAMRAERLAAMGRVAATLAHEVNNPLQAIRSNLELLQAFDLDRDERRKRVDVGLEAIDRLLTATQRALQLRTTSLEDRETVPLRDPVRRTFVLMVGPLREADIAVTVDLPVEQVYVHVAVDQIVQVLINLVVNAIDAINTGGYLHVTVRGEEEYGVIEVSNSGPHFTVEQRTHLFDPHFTTKAGHVGIGLSLSQDIIGLHGGTICAENLDGKAGVQFTIRLPLAHVDER